MFIKLNTFLPLYKNILYFLITKTQSMMTLKSICIVKLYLVIDSQERQILTDVSLIQSGLCKDKGVYRCTKLSRAP